MTIKETRSILKGVAYLAFKDPAGLPDVAAWIGSLRPGRDPVLEGAPSLSFRARRWLAVRVGPGTKIFEFGTGGSTVYFAGRGADVVSVEHDPDWHARVRAELDRRGLRARVFLVPPEPVDDAAAKDWRALPYRSRYGAWRGFSFERYVRSIEEWPDRSFDLVLVDGRARGSCLEAAIPKIRPGGHLMLDDSGRRRYACALEILDQFPVEHLNGVAPYRRSPSRTSAWRIGGA